MTAVSGACLLQYHAFSGFEAPSIFIAYAHDSNEKNPPAHSKCVHHLIDWLKTIRANVLSDKSPLRLWSPSSTDAAARDIISNQLRLLPAQQQYRQMDSTSSIDKILICGSPLLEQYYRHEFTGSYINDILAAYRHGDNHQGEIRSLVEASHRHQGFHHVLTELAFLQLRQAELGQDHGIIPISLDGGDLSYLPFCHSYDLRLDISPHLPDLRKRFFKLVRRIYTDQDRLIEEFQNCYLSISKRLETETLLSEERVQQIGVEELNKAMKNIREDVQAAYVDVHYSRFRAKNSSVPAFMVPFGQNANFIGREGLLGRLLDLIPPASTPGDYQRVAIEGLGGIGKTQLALEAVHRLHQADPDLSVYWVPAVNTTLFENAYREIGHHLGLKGLDRDDIDVKALVKNALDTESRPWLLVVDNADDPRLMLGSDDQEGLACYLPFNRNGSILVTTRHSEVTARLDIMPRATVRTERMSYSEALDLLNSGLDSAQTRNAADTDSLLDHLAYFPLAIKQASKYMARTRSSTSKYLGLLRASDEATIDMLSEDFEDKHRHPQTQNPVAKTWLISFETMSKTNGLAVEYLKTICFMAEKNVPEALVVHGLEKQATEAIGELKAYSFIVEREDGQSYDTHRLVRLATRNWIRQQGQWDSWLTEGVKRLDDMFPWPTHKNRVEWIHYLPHTQYVAEIDDPNDNDTQSALLDKIGGGYNLLGSYSRAATAYEKAVCIREQVLGREHPETLTSMNNLANVLDSQGKYEEAEAMHRETLAFREKVLSQENLSTLTSTHNLAGVVENLQMRVVAQRVQEPPITPDSGNGGKDFKPQNRYLPRVIHSLRARTRRVLKK